MDERRRAGRTRLRPLDWVITAARPRLGPRAAVSPSVHSGGLAFREWLSRYWAPGLRVLEVCGGAPVLADDALQRRAGEYACLAPIEARVRGENLGRRGWNFLQGDPAALARCGTRYDLVAWLRAEEDLAAVFEAADGLLTPRGLLAARTAQRLDLGATLRWLISDVVALDDGGHAFAARRRRVPQPG